MTQIRKQKALETPLLTGDNFADYEHQVAMALHARIRDMLRHEAEPTQESTKELLTFVLDQLATTHGRSH